MNEDAFNMSLRSFLKEVGVTSQREIERAVRAALEQGRLQGTGRLRARAVVTLEDVDLTHEVEGRIALD